MTAPDVMTPSLQRKLARLPLLPGQVEPRTRRSPHAPHSPRGREYAGLEPLPVGHCWLCGGGLGLSAARHWHSTCGQLWGALVSVKASQAYDVVAKAYGQRCIAKADSFAGQLGYERCPVTDPRKLQVDHVRPLATLTDTERRDLRWWGIDLAELRRCAVLQARDRTRTYHPPNLQLLCGPCHRAKSARETKERARVRALQKEALTP